MTRSEFIREHVQTCTAGRCKRYDPKRRRVGLHTLAYSRRKCAVHLWRLRQRAATPAKGKRRKAVPA